MVISSTSTSNPYGSIITIILDLNFDYAQSPPPPDQVQAKVIWQNSFRKISFVGFDSTINLCKVRTRTTIIKEKWSQGGVALGGDSDDYRKQSLWINPGFRLQSKDVKNKKY